MTRTSASSFLQTPSSNFAYAVGQWPMANDWAVIVIFPKSLYGKILLFSSNLNTAENLGYTVWTSKIIVMYIYRKWMTLELHSFLAFAEQSPVALVVQVTTQELSIRWIAPLMDTMLLFQAVEISIWRGSLVRCVSFYCHFWSLLCLEKIKHSNCILPTFEKMWWKQFENFYLLGLMWSLFAIMLRWHAAINS